MLDWSEPKAAPLPPVAAGEGLPIGPEATGLGKIDRNGARVTVDEKRMINARADVNQLLPMKYTWA